MATDTDTLAHSSTLSDGEFQAFNTFISDLLTAGGITKTADTGQINVASATLPGSNNSAAGYEIREFTDTLSSTKPVVFKIEYGRGVGAGRYQIWMTIGTGSDGSGNITGTFWTRATLGHSNGLSGGNAFPGSNPSYGCVKDGNKLVFACGFATSNSSAFAFALERTIDATKTVTGDGLKLYCKSNTSSVLVQPISFTGTHPTGETNGTCLPPANQTSGQHSDGDCAVYPVFVFGTGETLMPMVTVVGLFSGDKSANSTFTPTVFGSTQTMMVLHNGGAAKLQRGTVPSDANFTGAILYE